MYNNQFMIMVRKSGKTKKNDKSQRRQLEMGIFEKIQKKFKKKHQILSVHCQNYKIPYI